jgi:hypothetical protein
LLLTAAAGFVVFGSACSDSGSQQAESAASIDAATAQPSAAEQTQAASGRQARPAECTTSEKSCRDAGMLATPARGMPASGGKSAPPPSAADAATSKPREDADEDAGTPDKPDTTQATSDPPFFASVALEDGTSKPQLGHGDLWPNCWSNDDILYVAAGDGQGFGILPADVLVAAITGRPGDAGYRGMQLSAADRVSSIWSGDKYNRKPTGMLCQDGELYLAVQDLRRETFEDAPAATIVKSTDKGRTWTWDRAAPMFADHVFTTIMFLDFGKDSQHAPDDYVYAYGLDDNWAFSEFKPGPTQLFLARVPRDRVQTRTSWQFFTGFEASGAPRFSADIAERKPVLEDTRRVLSEPLDPMLRFQNMTTINQGGVVYNAPLKRYLYSSWTEYTFELYEAPQPWGPFRLFHSQDFGMWPWNDARNGGYGTTIPSKFISEDGKDMLLQANSWPDVTGKDNYSFSLRELHVEPYKASAPTNQPAETNLATQDRGATRLVRAARNARAAIMNDAQREGAEEDSFNGEAKTEDFWGYTWTQAQQLNTLRYTTGKQAAVGGYFEQLGVQIRKGSDWVNVPLKSVEPAYPGNSDTPEFTTYTLRFDTVVSDGVRVFGQPGGSDHYTSIAELSAHFE